MKVSIQCFGQLRTITKERFVEIEVGNQTSVLEALELFSEKFGDEIVDLLYRDGRIRDFYFIQVDKKNVENSELDKIIIKDEQTISIIPFIAGG